MNSHLHPSQILWLVITAMIAILWFLNLVFTWTETHDGQDHNLKHLTPEQQNKYHRNKAIYLIIGCFIFVLFTLISIK